MTQQPLVRPSPPACARPDTLHPPDFETFYQAMWPAMLRLGRLLTGSTVAAEEIVQDSFVGLYRRYHVVENPRAYLRRSLVNAARSAHRRRRDHEPLTVESEPLVHPPELDETWKALRVLTARQRATVVLRFYEDLPLADIAVALECSVGTVKSTLARSLTRLRKELS